MSAMQSSCPPASAQGYTTTPDVLTTLALDPREMLVREISIAAATVQQLQCHCEGGRGGRVAVLQPTRTYSAEEHGPEVLQAGSRRLGSSNAWKQKHSASDEKSAPPVYRSGQQGGSGSLRERSSPKQSDTTYELGHESENGSVCMHAD